MYMYIGWENALRPELNQVINQKWDHKIRNILIKRAGIRYIALPCPTLGKWKPGELQCVFISILNRVGFYQAILLTTPLVITAHLNSFPAGCFLLCWRPRVAPWVGWRKEMPVQTWRTSTQGHGKVQVVQIFENWFKPSHAVQRTLP